MEVALLQVKHVIEVLPHHGSVDRRPIYMEQDFVLKVKEAFRQ